MNIVWIAVLTAASGVALVGLIYVLKRWPSIGIVCAAITVLISWEIPQLPVIFSVGGNSIYALDALTACFLVIGLTSIRSLFENIGAAAFLWLLLGALLVISWLRGIPEFGLGAATNEFRLFLGPFAVLTWTMSRRSAREHQDAVIARFAVLLGWGLVAIAVIHIAHNGLGDAAELIDSGSGLIQTTRPLVSGQALMLLICAAICLWIWRRDSRGFFLVSAIIFGVVVMLVQQRTVWGVGIAAIVAILVLGKLRTKAIVIGAGIVLAAVVPFLLVSADIRDMWVQLQASAENSATYDARVVSWLNLVSQSYEAGSEVVTFGAPMGSGYGRLEGVDRWVTFTPHNWYLTLYLRVGAVGLFFFLSFIAITLIQAVRNKSNMAVVAVLVMLAVYGWSYSWLWYSCIFAGWAYSYRSLESNDDRDVRAKVALSEVKQKLA